MDPTDLTIEILKGIRDEARSTKEELRAEIRATRDELRVELHSTVDGLRAELRSEIRGTEMRLATELVAVASAVGLVTAELRGIRADRELFSVTTGGLRARIDDHEARLGALEKKAR